MQSTPGARSPEKVEYRVLWDRQGTPTALSPLPGNTRSVAHGINVRGEVVGWSGTNLIQNSAVTWDRQGTPTALSPLPGDSSSQAYAINARSEVVGNSRGNAGSTAVIWDQHGRRPPYRLYQVTPTAMRMR